MTKVPHGKAKVELTTIVPLAMKTSLYPCEEPDCKVWLEMVVIGRLHKQCYQCPKCGTLYLQSWDVPPYNGAREHPDAFDDDDDLVPLSSAMGPRPKPSRRKAKPRRRKGGHR